MAKMVTKAVGYMRTSSATNVGHDKDSDKRQRSAILAYAKANGFEVVDWYYDAAVSGADPVDTRPGFAEMLVRLTTNGAKTIIVESPDRFARDLIVQLTGHDLLKSMGIALIPTTAPDFFTDDTPTAVLVRQVLGAIAQFEKASVVAKLAAARKRKRETGVKVDGRKSHSELRPEVVEEVRRMVKPRGKARPMSYREVSAALAERGILSSTGKPFTASSIRNMVKS